MNQSYNNQFIKNQNRLGIMKKVAQNRDINRVLLAREMNLTTAAITKIITPMIEEGFLEEESYWSEVRGRKSRYLRLSSGRYCVITIRLTRPNAFAAIEDINGTILALNTYTTGIDTVRNEDIMSYIRQMAERIPSGQKCLAVVVVTPGSRQEKDARRRQKNTVDGPFFWDFHDIEARVEKEFGFAFTSENDSNTALLGELWFGAGRNAANGPVVLYNIGGGVGAAAYMNGNLISGYNGSAVEIGHTTVDINGPRCKCGNYGCLELYAGTPRWIEDVAKDHLLSSHIGRFESCFDMAKSGDPLAVQLVEKYARTLAIGLQTLSAVFAPSTIIVVTNEADYIDIPAVIDVMDREIRERMYSLSRNRDMEILPGELGNMGFLKGSIVFALENHFSETDN